MTLNQMALLDQMAAVQYGTSTAKDSLSPLLYSVQEVI